MKIVTAFFFAVIVFTSHAQSRIRFYDDTARTRNEILRAIPPGTDTSNARRILNKNHFKHISKMNEAQFAAGAKVFSHINFLYAEHERGSALISRRWQVALIEENGKVKNILVSFGMTGL